MPTARTFLAGLALALTATACSDKAPTAPTNSADNPTQPQQKAARQPLIFPANQAFTGYTLTSIQVTRFGLNSSNQLTVDAVLTFSDGIGGTVTEAITDAPATLTGSGAPTAATCQILTLDIGAIHLDLLGLVVDLAPVHLNITAQSGSGALLGNLLCALTHLLDQSPLNIAAITQLLQQINALLTQILG